MAAQVAINDIWVCKDPRCVGQCNTKVGLCQYMIAGADAPAAAGAADVIHTSNGGTTWTNAAAFAFGVGENIVSVGCFSVSDTVTRWIAVRGVELAPANPIEIAYSDDSGATWTKTDVETGGTRYAADSGALFILDQKHIWLVSTGGYIFFSSDGGLNWTNQSAGGVTVQNYNAVMFANENDGFAVAALGVVARTIDGGDTWDAVTTITGTPSVLCVYVFDKDNVIVGDSAGEIWRSWDGGTTWTQVYTSTDSINDLDFVNRFVGFAIADDTIIRTRNGGEDWEVVSGTPTAVEFNAIVACDENTAYTVGEAGANVGAIVEISG